MAKKNGMWNVITMKLCPGSMGLRHFVPLLFVLSIIGLVVLGFCFKPLWILLGVELSLYLILDFAFSLKISSSIKEVLVLLFLFPLFHFSYGIGSIEGILLLFSKKYHDKTYKAPIL